jgi:hypothetical protein
MIRIGSCKWQTRNERRSAEVAVAAAGWDATICSGGVVQSSASSAHPSKAAADI